MYVQTYRKIQSVRVCLPKYYSVLVYVVLQAYLCRIIAHALGENLLLYSFSIPSGGIYHRRVMETAIFFSSLLLCAKVLPKGFSKIF